MSTTDLIDEAHLDALAAKIALRYNTLKGNLGDKTTLTTTVKTTIVAAINELVTAISALSGAGAINDGATGSGTTWSSTQITAHVTSRLNTLLNGAGAAYDTFAELQALIETDVSGIAALTTAVGNRIRYDAAQSLTAPQQAQAQANLGIVRSTADLATAFENATA